MAAKKPKVGDIVRVTFLDHAENSRDALMFEVFGRISKVTSKAYLIRAWGYESELDRASDSNPDNEHSFAIVKRAIDSIRILR